MPSVHSKIVDMSLADDAADEEHGDSVKKLRIGSSTNSNYKSGMKKIMEYFQTSPKWKGFVIADVENPSAKFPFTLDIPVPLASLKACFGYYATKPISKARKRGHRGGKRTRKQATRKKRINEDTNSGAEDSDGSSGSDEDDATADARRERVGNRARSTRPSDIRRYANSEDNYEDSVAEEELSDGEEVPFNEEEFSHLKNIDKATISFSGLAGYYK
jgi:hypothetical protein